MRSGLAEIASGFIDDFLHLGGRQFFGLGSGER